MLGLVLSLSACHDQRKHRVTVVNGVNIPQLLPKDTTQGKPEERLTIRSTYNAAIDALRKNSDDPGPYLRLAEAYIMQSRISGNSAYYQAAVLQMLNRLISSESSTGDQRFMANMYKSNVLFGMNRFKEALDAANEGLKLGDGNASIWGAATDANVELGNYAEANKTSSRMMQLRPDLRSYARASYLRELAGDMTAAIETMAMAVESGVPGLEPTEWARVQLGDLCLNAGKSDSARILYEAALHFRPRYAAAQEGLARLAMYRKDYKTAILYADSAATGMNDPLYLAQLATVYQLAGNGAKAADAVQAALRSVKDEEGEIPQDMNPKPNYAREYALIYRAGRNIPKALGYAKEDQQLRPENAQANALLAWLLYLNGEAKSAAPLIQKSLATGWKNPEILMQASWIYRGAGDAAKSEALRQESLKLNPMADPVIDAEVAGMKH
jgi:tetratricopeptide (TPR) repeat protein